MRLRSPLKEVGEDRLVARFRELASAGLGDGILVGPGDDAAAIRIGDKRVLLLTCDMMVEEVHFRRDWASSEQIGWKALAQNLSDIAAMGGEPAFVVSSIAAPGHTDQEVVEGIARGLIACASRYGATLVGGDLVGSPGPIAVDVAVTGWVEDDLLVRRSGARPGDVVVVTGALGAAAAGLVALRRGLAEKPEAEVTRALQAHREPQPRLAEGRAIAGARRATAMMDVSDGLANDLPRLCAESGVGARLYVERIPVDPACAAVADKTSADAVALATSGGEDYELLFTCPSGAIQEIAAAVSAASGSPVTVIGEIVPGDSVTLVDARGKARSLGTGFNHFAVSRTATS